MFPCARAEGMGECAKANFADTAPSAHFHRTAQFFTSPNFVIAARPLRGRTSSDALRAPPSPRGEGSCALGVMSAQTQRATDGRPYKSDDFYLNQTCYHGSPASRAHGNISSQIKFVTLRAAMCYFAQRCVTSRSDVLLREAMCYIHR